MTQIKLITWNVNGLRAIQRKGFWDIYDKLKADVFAIQEIKTDNEKMQAEIVKFHDKDLDIQFLSASMKKGYSGVATISNVVNNEGKNDIFGDNKNLNNPKLRLTATNKGLNNHIFDEEGRIVITKYETIDKKLRFTLINGYYPQGGRGQHRIDYKIEFYKEVVEIAKNLQESGENVIICGDLNTAVSDLDLARPKENRKTTGCLPEEREALNWFFENGWIDAFRYFYPDKEGCYTYWDQITRARDRNVGWRIDYFLVHKSFLKNVKSCEILPDIMGSDHCPVELIIEV